MQAGRLDRRFRFDKRVETSDEEYGNTVAGFEHQFAQAASLKFLRGGETVIAARLTARHPAILTIRNSTQARQVNANWRAVDDRTGVVYAIRENPKHPVDRSGKEDRGSLEMLVESGVAA